MIQFQEVKGYNFLYLFLYFYEFRTFKSELGNDNLVASLVMYTNVGSSS